MLSRRKFLVAGAAALGTAAAGAAFGQATASDSAFEFALFGDTHFDKLAHHDFDFLTELEPKFQPESVELPRKQFAAEKPHVAHFEYAETAGHAMLRVDGRSVTARIFNGASDVAWKEIDVTQLLQSA